MTVQRISTLVAATALLACAMPTLAVDINGQFAIKGVGTLNCEAYVKAANAGNNELALFAGYVTGYVSSYNESQPETFDILPWQSMETVMLLLLKRCQQFPSASFGATMTHLARVFDDNKLDRLTERVTIGDGNSSVKLFAPVADEVRAALDKRGYDTGDLYAALRRYQQDQDLPPATDNIQTTLLTLLYTE